MSVSRMRIALTSTVTVCIRACCIGSRLTTCGCVWFVSGCAQQYLWLVSDRLLVREFSKREISRVKKKKKVDFWSSYKHAYTLSSIMPTMLDIVALRWVFSNGSKVTVVCNKKTLCF